MIIDMIIDTLVSALSVFCAAYAVFDFLIGVSVHTTEWYLKAIFMILFALYLWNMTK